MLTEKIEKLIVGFIVFIALTDHAEKDVFGNPIDNSVISGTRVPVTSSKLVHF